MKSDKDHIYHAFEVNEENKDTIENITGKLHRRYLRNPYYCVIPLEHKYIPYVLVDAPQFHALYEKVDNDPDKNYIYQLKQL